MLELTGLDYQQYLKSTQLFTLLLGTATVALAIPLYQKLDLIRSHAVPILVTLIAGAVFAPAVAIGIAWLAGATDITLLSIAPKTVTTPIAMAVAESMGGLTTVAAGTVISVGIFGAVMAPPVMSWMGITSPTVKGFTLGLTSHAVGTARAFEISPVCGAFFQSCTGFNWSDDSVLYATDMASYQWLDFTALPECYGRAVNTVKGCGSFSRVADAVLLLPEHDRCSCRHRQNTVGTLR